MSGQIHHFEYGVITPILSYALSVLGSVLALTCAVRARESTTTGQRARWIAGASIALGGTAIWTMHFMAMLGFGVEGTTIRYGVPLTVISLVLAIVSVGIGLSLVGFGRADFVKILGGGLFTGIGVAAMHYTGMAGMQLDGTISYDVVPVVLSVLIAVVAAIVALWLSVRVRGGWAIAGSALIMGVAVNGMHFTGMTAMHVELHSETIRRSGVTAGTLLVPIVVAVVIGVIGLVYAMLAAPSEEDRAALAYFESRRNATAAPGPAPAGTPVEQGRRGAVAAGEAFPQRPHRASTPGGSGFNGFEPKNKA
ncbi:NO-binding membrane sensor protein with MHYT domain [Catenuloplanes nepalensis]|uniref:NO-binding membrane sensor protein with MHYT domain n=1 Tax=Catenuloplanes nepalensis TaxID=587533 RepID=A0ABT9MW69_9ACTN|nr:MHYT domain-containing protein [Catenuloplanes nepalensis]MDP9795686.1 NO-binding membrane sensor protein with MHYT domain [Catenuloplanes nepalensis]